MGEEVSNKQKIGFGTIFLITLNGIFASSLTYLPGLSVQSMGAKALIAWAIVFVLGMYLAMALAELITLFPSAGDLYVYAKHAYGHFFAFIIGWTSWITGNIGASLGIVWALEYFNPSATLEAYLIKLAIGLGLIAVFNYARFRGLSLKKVVLIGFSVITLFVLTLQILPIFVNLSAISGVRTEIFSLQTFAMLFHNTQTFGAIVIFSTVFIISEAIMGMEIITFLSEEAKNPETIPKALIYAMGVAALITIVYVVGSTSILPIGKYISSAIPHKDIMHLLLSSATSKVVFIGTALMIISPFILWVFIGPNLLRSLGRDRLILKQLSEIHPKFKTPGKGILFQSIVMAIFTIFMYFLYMNHHHDPYKLVHEVFVILVLFILAITVMIVPIFRRRYQHTKRTFKLPGGRVVPYIIVATFIFMGVSFGMYTQEWHVFLKAATLVLIGIPIYFLLNIFYNPEATRRVNDQLSFLSLWFENYSLPKSIRRKIVGIFGDITGKHIFEFGASIGTITLELAKAVGPSGSVEAVDLSESNIKLLRKRLARRNHTHVKAIHDEHMINRVHPEIKEADVIFSVGSIDYIQDLQKVLKEMADILPENGRICIVEYSDFFGIIPDSGWKSNLEELEKVFQRAGFRIRMLKWKGFLWNYICIYGIKTDKEIVVI